MDFYTIIIIIAACFLILCLIGVGILMQKYNLATNFPPVQNPCPDRWIVKGQTCLINTDTNNGFIKDNVSKFVNDTYGISTIDSGNTVTNPLNGYTTVDFNNTKWNNAGSSLCSKKKWANQYGIAWDGISNNTGC